MQNPEERTQVLTPEIAPEKKPYEKPEIVYHAPLEAMASDCSSGGKESGVCGAGFS